MGHSTVSRWERIWRTRNWFRAALYSLLAVLIIGAAVAFLLPSARILWGWLLADAASLFVLAGVGEWRLTSWPCPRCGERFYSRALRLGSNTLGEALAGARSCAHCGLPWSEARNDPHAPRLTSARSRRGARGWT
jgi:hypothetical protein